MLADNYTIFSIYKSTSFAKTTNCYQQFNISRTITRRHDLNGEK